MACLLLILFVAFPRIALLLLFLLLRLLLLLLPERRGLLRRELEPRLGLDLLHHVLVDEGIHRLQL